MTKSLLRVLHRYVVTYEDCQSMKTMTFAVENCALASIAVALTILFIEDKGLHTGELGYALIPRISRHSADYNIE